MEEKLPLKEQAKNYFKTLPKRYFITAFSGMAQGLFVTLIAGTILAMIAGWIGVDKFDSAKNLIAEGNFIGNTLLYIANIAKTLMGAGIGVGIAHALGKKKLLIFSAAVAGMVGAFADKLLFGSFAGDLFPKVVSQFTSISFGTPGNPIGAYVVTMFVIEIVGLYEGKTKLDIILVPMGALILSFLGMFLAAPFIWLVDQLGLLIALATKATPFFMGIIVAVIMGIVLTMPTSSAAIWVAVASPIITGYTQGTISFELYDAMLLAGGAATVGCACHMVGFAVASFRENGVGGLIAQGLGTSMLQIPNIMKKPITMLPMIISSAVCGPLATCVFKLKCGASGGGMGTSGLVGVFDLFAYTDHTALGIIGIILLMFILPAGLNILFSEIMRKKGWLKFGDLKLPD
ncbi:MAG: PTS sugar transporter subunit IIC [Clostridia bacterium]|nr:PTS sugar transporter subunit IIC [Clostridia bacterium]